MNSCRETFGWLSELLCWRQTEAIRRVAGPGGQHNSAAACGPFDGQAAESAKFLANWILYSNSVDFSRSF